MQLKLFPKPTRVAVVGRSTRFIQSILREHGFYVSSRHPELVVSFGGDGTLLHAEHAYPGVPKVCVRHDVMCSRCASKGGASIQALSSRSKLFFCRNCFSGVATYIASNPRMAVREEIKLEGHAFDARGVPKGKPRVALNEINVHNQRPQQALRGSAHVNTRPRIPHFIADGVIVSTPFGSSGYFYSCTRKRFSSGIGIAVINATRRIPPLLLPNANSSTRVSVFIQRHRRHKYADNMSHAILLQQGDVVEVRLSKQNARFVHVPYAAYA